MTGKNPRTHSNRRNHHAEGEKGKKKKTEKVRGHYTVRQADVDVVRNMKEASQQLTALHIKPPPRKKGKRE